MFYSNDGTFRSNMREMICLMSYFNKVIFFLRT